ncbi:hypothetical protein HN873_064630, partial [Arachis hypogaea]
PSSIAFFAQIGLDYVSYSPFRNLHLLEKYQWYLLAVIFNFLHMLVGDDLLMSNAKCIERAVLEYACNALLLKTLSLLPMELGKSDRNIISAFLFLSPVEIQNPVNNAIQCARSLHQPSKSREVSLTFYFIPPKIWTQRN